MIPLRDNIPSRRFPVITVLLILANVLVFLFELSLGRRGLPSFFYEFAVIPVRYTHGLAITPGGGLQETRELLPLEAPLDGYREEVSLGSKRDDPKWSLIKERKFYVKLPNGSFGRILVRIYAADGIFEIYSALNLSGSPNLEGARNISGYQKEDHTLDPVSRD